LKSSKHSIIPAGARGAEARCSLYRPATAQAANGNVNGLLIGTNPQEIQHLDGPHRRFQWIALPKKGGPEAIRARL
jgi:hypothetical protein